MSICLALNDNLHCQNKPETLPPRTRRPDFSRTRFRVLALFLVLANKSCGNALNFCNSKYIRIIEGLTQNWVQGLIKLSPIQKV